MMYTGSSIRRVGRRPPLVHPSMGRCRKGRVRCVYLGCKSAVSHLSADGSHAYEMVGGTHVRGPLTASPRFRVCTSLHKRPAHLTPLALPHQAPWTLPPDMRAGRGKTSDLLTTVPRY